MTSLITGKLKLLPLEILSKMYNKRMIFSYSEYTLSLSLYIYIYTYIHTYIYIYMYMVSKLNWGLGQKYLKAEVFLWVTIVSNFCATQDWNRAGHRGALGCKILSVSPISWWQEVGFIQPPLPSLSSNRQVQTMANPGREGKTREKAALGQAPGSPSRGIHNNELFCR